MHMVHHVVDGIKLHGPVHSMWMYVYERFNSWVCKRVTNRSQPETTVMQTYKVRQDLCYYIIVTYISIFNILLNLLWWEEVCSYKHSFNLGFLARKYV